MDKFYKQFYYNDSAKTEAVEIESPRRDITIFVVVLTLLLMILLWFVVTFLLIGSPADKLAPVNIPTTDRQPDLNTNYDNIDTIFQGLINDTHDSVVTRYNWNWKVYEIPLMKTKTSLVDSSAATLTTLNYLNVVPADSTYDSVRVVEVNDSVLSK